MLFQETHAVNYSSTCRLKANEDNANDEIQSKDNKKTEKDSLVSRKYDTFFNFIYIF